MDVLKVDRAFTFQVCHLVLTVTIIPFIPSGWAASADGFSAVTGNIPFLMKDIVLFAPGYRFAIACGHAEPL